MKFFVLSLAALAAAQGYDPICASDKAYAACCDPNMATDERYCKLYDPSGIQSGDQPRLEYFKEKCANASASDHPNVAVRTPRCCRLDGFNTAISNFDLTCNLSDEEVQEDQVCPDGQGDTLCCPSQVAESRTAIQSGITCDPVQPTASALFVATCTTDDGDVPRCCSSRTTTYSNLDPVSTATLTTCNQLPPVAPTEPITSPIPTPTPTPVCPTGKSPRCCKPGAALLDTNCKKLNPEPTNVAAFREACLLSFKNAYCCPFDLLGLGVGCVSP